MVSIDDDSPDALPPDPLAGRLPFGSPRFARLVQSPVARRLSPRRLAAGVALGGLLAWGLVEAGSRGASVVAHWVGGLPEHQVPFDGIKLSPPPPDFIRPGAAGLLATVRDEAKYPAAISTLDADFEALRVALTRNPWIEAAGPIRTSYGQIAAGVAYRRPVGFILPKSPTDGRFVLLDARGVELPIGPDQVAWSETGPRFRVLGATSPLVQVLGLGRPGEQREGLIFRSTDPEVGAPQVEQAAHLADFLQAHAAGKTPGGRAMPDFVGIEYHREFAEVKQGGVATARMIAGFYACDITKNWIFWHSAPGAEALDEPRAAAKWEQLARYIDERGPLNLDRDREYLNFTLRGAEVVPFNLDGRKVAAPAPSPAANIEAGRSRSRVSR